MSAGQEAAEAAFDLPAADTPATEDVQAN
jgi:hypothetical protein